MTGTVERLNKRNLFIVGTAAALALAPCAAAEEASSAGELNALRSENAQLRNRLAEMERKLAQATGPSNQSKSRYSLKKLNSGYSNGAGAGKTSSAMTCGATMHAGKTARVQNAGGKTSGAMTCGASMQAGQTTGVQGAGGKTSGEMTCGANMMYRMPRGSLFYYNPVFGGTEDMFHTHPEGMWMFNVKWMHSEKDGLQFGRSPVGAAEVGPSVLPGAPFPAKYPYMMIPTRMTMDMLMFMMMYGVTDRLTVNGMVNYQGMDMAMLQDVGNAPTMMGMPPGPYHQISGAPPMVTGGLGDTQLYASYKAYDDATYGNVVATLGLSVPTGDTRQQISMMGFGFRAPYDMQLGSGTVDFKPALTYSWLSEDAKWNFGAQVLGTIHMNTTDGWAYGNGYKLSAWAQHAITDAASIWVRTTYSDTAPIRGADTAISCINFPCYYAANPMQVAPMPDADPHNYGGQILNFYGGAAYQYHAMSLGVEVGLPAYQNLNGLQLRNHWQVTTGIQAMY